MANVVENLGKLERRVTISLPKDAVQKEVDSRIRQLAKNVRMPGFRPGKVPLKMVTQQYSGQVEAEVLSDKVGKEFFDISRAENLRVAGQPSFAPKADAVEGDYAFDATFEVYPEVKLGDVATAELELARRKLRGDCTANCLRASALGLAIETRQRDVGEVNGVPALIVITWF